MDDIIVTTQELIPVFRQSIEQSIDMVKMMPHEHQQQALVIWQELTKTLMQVIKENSPGKRSAKKRQKPLTPRGSATKQVIKSVDVPETVKLKLFPSPSREAKRGRIDTEKQTAGDSGILLADENCLEHQAATEPVPAGSVEPATEPLSLRRTRRKSKPTQALLEMLNKNKKVSKSDPQMTDQISQGCKTSGSSETKDNKKSPSNNKNSEKSPRASKKSTQLANEEQIETVAKEVENREEDVDMEEDSQPDSEDIQDADKVNDEDFLPDNDSACSVNEEDEESDTGYSNAPEIFESLEEKKRPSRKAEQQQTKASKATKSTCKQCGKVLANYSNLRVHMRVHSGEKPFSCAVCGRKFSTKPNMVRHQMTHTGAKPYECPDCHKCFTENKSMMVHRRSHTGEKPYKCDICSKRFTQTGSLQSHMHTHTGWKGHFCDICGKSFRQKSQLKLHQMRHNNVRKHVCEICSKAFISKGDLERHRMRHTGERPFLCTMCPKTFTRLQYLKEHWNQHIGNKPHKCKYCEESFHDQSSCSKHMRKHEPKAETSSTAAKNTTVNAPVGETYYVILNSDPQIGSQTLQVESANVQHGNNISMTPVSGVHIDVPVTYAESSSQVDGETQIIVNIPSTVSALESTEEQTVISEIKMDEQGATNVINQQELQAVVTATEQLSAQMTSATVSMPMEGYVTQEQADHEVIITAAKYEQSGEANRVQTVRVMSQGQGDVTELADFSAINLLAAATEQQDAVLVPTTWRNPMEEQAEQT